MIFMAAVLYSKGLGHLLKRDSTHTAIFIEHRAALINYAAPILGCRARAEDVVQEAYIRLSSKNDVDVHGQQIASPISYLYRIVRNLAIDWTRRASNEDQQLSPEMFDQIPAQIPDIEETVLFRDELRVLSSALDELPERTQTAFRMHRLEGRTLEEIATRLEVSVVRAHQLVKQALVHCAKKLDDSGG